MRPRRWLCASAAALLIPATLTVTSATTSSADQSPHFTATPIAAISRATADKAPSARLAKTDPKLLSRTDSTPVAVVIKLDYDAVATYAGGVPGYAATSPAVTGQRLRGSVAEQRYEGFQAGRERVFTRALARAVPAARVGQALRTVYGGVTATLPANKVGALLKIDGVVAVQRDQMRKLLTDASPHFIGADTLDPQLHGAANAGRGIIFGSLDSGVWPEHPSFADQGNLSAPPAKADGTARTCDFGSDPLTPYGKKFHCNNKLIGGAPFLDTYNTVVGGEVYTSARDSDGHGTHTASTSAGDVLASAKVLGVERGPVRGIAPGAWLSVYKVCGVQGCFSSDSLAAVTQAILDGVQVINYSISGGGDPYTDPTELGFLDAYAAGVFVAASAGNSGPGAATTDHVSPWVTTVAASTQQRAFTSTLTLRSGADSLVLTGASITAGVSTQTPVVSAADAPYSSPKCDTDPTPGLFTGKIVICMRGSNARVDKGYRVLKGGAVGMILYNPTLADVETDNHWLPAVHLADGTALTAWLGTHTNVTAAFTAGQKSQGTGDVMAAFSSRGPGGLGIKPDITAPGVEILAGNTPTPDTTDVGPPGQYFQAIAGTSMSSPHIAGAAILMKAVHPDWTPGQIKSALMTTARTAVLKEDETTPADPFDYGSGRVDLSQAPLAGLTLDETPDRMFALGADAVHAIDLNQASVNAPVMPGEVSTSRTVRNVTNRTQSYSVSITSPAGSRISVWPRSFTVRPGQSRTLDITISSTAETAQYFGQIRLVPARSGLPVQHLPVGFVPKQGGVTLTSSCSPEQVRWLRTSTCTISAANTTSSDTTATIRTRVGPNLAVVGVDGARRTGPTSVQARNVSLTGAVPGTPSIAPGESPAGYLDLAGFGIAPEAVGDEDIVNFTVPQFSYVGETYTSIGVTSDGYLVAGGGTAQDVQYEPVIPSPARPNNVLAPFWADLTGAGAQGLRVGTLSDGTNTWIVVQWNVFAFGSTADRTFQVWLGTTANGAEDVSFAYDTTAMPTDPGEPFVVGAENRDGSAGSTLPDGVLPTTDLRVTSTAPTPGASVSYTVRVLGLWPGTGHVRSTLDSPIVPGTTRVSTPLVVTRR